MAKAKTETKEVIKKNTKTSKKKEVKKAKEIEIIDEIIDDVEEIEEDIEIDEIVPRKTYKDLKKEFRSKQYEIEVEILNLNSCATSCRGRDGRLIFNFNKSGDREFISLADISEVASRYKGFFEKHLIAIIDVDSDEYDLEDIITYLNLDEIYQENEIENYDTDYIGQILKMDAKKFKRLVEDANTNLETLAIKDVLLYPSFDNSVTNYNVEVSNDTYNITLLAIPEDEEASVDIVKSDVLQEGNNEIKITVTAKNNYTKKDYIINVYKRNYDEEIEYQEEQKKNQESLNNILEKTSTTIQSNDYNKQEYNEKQNETRNNIFYIISIILFFTIILLINKKLKNKKRKSK